MPGAPTLINLPPPPSDPATPSDIPGTPTSTITSMSELSTVAIKDGHRGHTHTSRTTAPADAERADRISRLAGLERVTTARQPSNTNLTPGLAAPPQSMTGYFDAQGNPLGGGGMGRERSTVGSASATGTGGSVGRGTWASGSVDSESARGEEEMDVDGDRSSVGGMTDEGTESLVGFGEGARTPARQNHGTSALSMLAAKSAGNMRGESVTPTAGVGQDGSVFGGSDRMDGKAVAERIVSQRIGDEGPGMESPLEKGTLGRFEFEAK